MAIKDVAVSSGSACTSASLEPSYVLRALGVGDELAHSSIRFGLGRFNTQEEVDYVADLVIGKVKHLREHVAPLRDAQGGHRSEDRRSGRRTEVPSENDEKRTSHGVQRESHRPRGEPAQRRHARQGRPERRHRPRRRAGLRGRDAPADPGERRRASSRTRSSRPSAAARRSRARRSRPSGSRARRSTRPRRSRTRRSSNELNLPPVKIHCSVLAEDAIKSAIADYRKKQADRAAAAAASVDSSERERQRESDHDDEPSIQQTRSEARDRSPCEGRRRSR